MPSISLRGRGILPTGSVGRDMTVRLSQLEDDVGRVADVTQPSCRIALEDQNLVGAPDGREPVGDDKRRPPVTQRPQPISSGTSWRRDHAREPKKGPSAVLEQERVGDDFEASPIVQFWQVRPIGRVKYDAFGQARGGDGAAHAIDGRYQVLDRGGQRRCEHGGAQVGCPRGPCVARDWDTALEDSEHGQVLSAHLQGVALDALTINLALNNLAGPEPRRQVELRAHHPIHVGAFGELPVAATHADAASVMDVGD